MLTASSPVINGPRTTKVFSGNLLPVATLFNIDDQSPSSASSLLVGRTGTDGISPVNLYVLLS